jgi:hypothetical protein
MFCISYLISISSTILSFGLLFWLFLLLIELGTSPTTTRTTSRALWATYFWKWHFRGQGVRHYQCLAGSMWMGLCCLFSFCFDGCLKTTIKPKGKQTRMGQRRRATTRCATTIFGSAMTTRFDGYDDRKRWRLDGQMKEIMWSDGDEIRR